MDFENENVNFTDDELQIEVSAAAEAGETAPGNKRKYILISAVAALLVLIGIFAFFRNKVFDINMYTKYTASDSKALSYEDINGRFTDEISGMYFDFKAEKAKAEHIIESEADSAAASDAAEVKTKKVTYDGTCESGYTDEYVNGILSSIYIDQNNMTEEYEKYLEEKGTVLDDFTGYTNKIGVEQSDLDAIDATHFISQEAKSYVQKCYWNFDEGKKEITIYNSDGNEISGFKVIGNELVALSGYFEGKAYSNERFESVFKLKEDGYAETFYFYNDGNFVVKVQPGDETVQRYSGEYKSDSSYVVISIDGQKMIYKKLSSGLSSITLKK